MGATAEAGGGKRSKSKGTSRVSAIVTGDGMDDGHARHRPAIEPFVERLHDTVGEHGNLPETHDHRRGPVDTHSPLARDAQASVADEQQLRGVRPRDAGHTLGGVEHVLAERAREALLCDEYDDRPSADACRRRLAVIQFRGHRQRQIARGHHLVAPALGAHAPAIQMHAKPARGLDDPGVLPESLHPRRFQPFTRMIGPAKNPAAPATTIA